jgi:hypothetical protein
MLTGPDYNEQWVSALSQSLAGDTLDFYKTTIKGDLEQDINFTDAVMSIIQCFITHAAATLANR